MSGHSKWATIKRQKGKTDAARANVFTKIGRELAVAVKSGGPDPNNNPRLRDVIAKARAANMPNDNITRSIKKASGEESNVVYDAITRVTATAAWLLSSKRLPTTRTALRRLFGIYSTSAADRSARLIAFRTCLNPRELSLSQNSRATTTRKL